MCFQLFKRCCSMEYRHQVYPLHYISCMIPLSRPALEVFSRFSRYKLSDISCRWRFRSPSDRFYSFRRHWYFLLMLERGRPRMHGSLLTYCIPLYWLILPLVGQVVTFYFEWVSWRTFDWRVIRGWRFAVAKRCQETRLQRPQWTPVDICLRLVN